jgi:replicative DNA helicase
MSDENGLKEKEEVFVNLDLERQLLRFLALTDFSLAIKISDAVFYGKAEKIVFKVLKKLQTHLPEATLREMVLSKVKDKDYDSVTLALDDIIDSEVLPSYKASELVLQSLTKLSLQRDLQDVGYQVIAHSADGDVDEAMKSIKGVLGRDSDRVESGEYVEDFPARYAYIEKREKEKSESKSDIIKTGIKQFDDAAGGLMKGEVGIIVGGTGVGKSISKLNFAAVAWLHGYNVIHIGLEMTKIENQLRLDTLLTQIPASAFRLAQLSEGDKKNWKKVLDAHKKKRKNYIEFVGGKALSMPEIFSVVEATESIRGKRADLVILDHLILVPRETGWDSTHQKHMSNMLDLSDWAKTRHVSVWTSMQSTDEGIKSKSGAGITDVKYSRGVVETAQIAVSIYQTEVDVLSGDLNFKVIKGRGIKSGDKLVLRPDFENMVLDTVSFYSLGLDKFINKSKRSSL